MLLGGHKPRKQGVLMAAVVGKLDPANEMIFPWNFSISSHVLSLLPSST